MFIAIRHKIQSWGDSFLLGLLTSPCRRYAVDVLFYEEGVLLNAVGVLFHAEGVLLNTVGVLFHVKCSLMQWVCFSM